MSTQGPRRTVTVGGTTFTLLGTAHVSRASAEEVKALIRSGEFDAVAVELCDSRYLSLTNPQALEQMDLFKVLRDGRGGMVAASLALGAYQQRLAEQFGIEPGAEMKTAAAEAKAAGAPLMLVDRDIGVTMKRLYRNIPWWQRFTLISGLFAGLFSREKVTEEDIERLKQGDILESTFAEFAQSSTRLYQPLIAERDRYMACRLLQETADKAHHNVLVVIGAGHLKGLADALEHPTADPASEQADLSQMPPPSPWPKRIAWLVVLLVLSGFAIGFLRSPELGMRLVMDWVLINGGLSAVGAAIAGGHPVTVLGAFFAAPLTSLNPTVGAGFVAAAIEMAMRRPRVGDFRSLRQAVGRWQGWWTNRVSRTLLVFLFASLGSAVGTYLAGFRIFERLIGS